MSIIKHSKISGEINTDVGLVGGEDWDAPHALGIGAMVPVSATSLLWNYGSTTFSTVARSKGTSLATRTSAGVYTFDYNDNEPTLVASADKFPTVIHSSSPRGAWPAGWHSEVSVADGTVTLRVFDDTSTLADPTLSVDFSVSVFHSIDYAV